MVVYGDAWGFLMALGAIDVEAVVKSDETGRGLDLGFESCLHLWTLQHCCGINWGTVVSKKSLIPM